MPVRYFTPEEAAATLPQLRPLLAALREAHHEHTFARAQVEDLRRMHGDVIFQPDHEHAGEGAVWVASMRETQKRVNQLLQEIRSLGAEVKDPIMGLVDFYAQREGETVLLCYRDDEDDLGWWHGVTDGYTGRRPLDEF